MWKWTRKKREDAWLPYFMPWVWHTVLAFAFSLGVVIGVGIAIYMLSLRGLW